MNNLFYYTTSIRVAPGAKYEIPQTRSIPAAITDVISVSVCGQVGVVTECDQWVIDIFY